jgi:hypothetical protein
MAEAWNSEEEKRSLLGNDCKQVSTTTESHDRHNR